MLKKTLCVISRVIEKKLFCTTVWWGRGFLLGVRTIASTVPGYEAKGWFGIVGVKGTPNAVVQKIYKDVNLVLNDLAVKERFAAAGMEVIADTPEQMKIKIEAERARLKVLIKERKIYIE